MQEERLPLDVDESRPSAARIYDYFLGGKDNFACDRAVADQLMRIAPETPAMARASRAFLGRAVRFIAEQGVRQFIDIGTGLPTRSNVHEIAQAVAPSTRVVYVDNDPAVLAHARALLDDNPQTAVVEADLRDPARLLNDPDLERLIDFGRPVGLIMVGIVYFLTEVDRPFDVVRILRDALPSGSYLAMTHVVADDRLAQLGQAQELYRSFTKQTGTGLRSRDEVTAFFHGLDLVEPGLVPTQNWRNPTPGDPSIPQWILGAVARKP
ncbi:SAM-dependent methyltransferase [Actinocrispum sp. NPDC049592]|uniref:SAM-dependent methyltransferase n=1 Tax=Actinocrispum sp. NPDC049592 TaxID=3154835 RepID=UPI00341B7EFC